MFSTLINNFFGSLATCVIVQRKSQLLFIVSTTIIPRSKNSNPFLNELPTMLAVSAEEMATKLLLLH